MTIAFPIDDFEPPSRKLVQALSRPAYAYFRPDFAGMEKVDPSRKLIFVGNHTLYGAFDSSVLWAELFLRKGIVLRSLGDRFHFYVPGTRALLTKFGVVDGRAEIADQLMAAGAPILVFPGGGREVMKRKGEAYQLIWKKRAGFARLAARHGYDIVPFGAVGGEEAFSIHWDANDFIESPIGKLAFRSKTFRRISRDGDVLPPVATGWARTPLPRRVKLRFSFGTPIAAEPYRDRADDPGTVFELREKVRQAVETEVAKLRSQS